MLGIVIGVAAVIAMVAIGKGAQKSISERIAGLGTTLLTVRPGARYFHSLRLLQRVKELDPTMFTKSGIMVGLGETRDEVLQVMDDLRAADVDFLTIWLYLQQTPMHHMVARFVTPDEFAG